MKSQFGVALLTWTILLIAQNALAQEQRLIPHAQDKPPGPALSPQEAIAKMTVPEGFKVELVASEPDIVNPVAMTIDERGRFWITESLEYPRKAPGPGKDRVKVLEDTDGDGKADKFTVFADGLNIPSGIAVGHGGVWVANSPDILFMQDTDGDGKADKQEVVVTGFGRTDTHELPNSLTWGPDGWLYGLNGVFNYSDVKYAKENPNYKAEHPGWKFTCALFRIHPKTREFELFAEGTSNPWGVAIDNEGSFFLSACVIDHLWHITETGYYHRQGGPYPPYTWKIESIVKHKHQKAAYCGIHYFDSDAYPAEYNKRLFMGNIHGGCINADVLERDGSTYFAKPAPDFLTANDAWFMPVVQKTGADGSLYILDWYDRYHCYQDANRDPAGIDRLKGRLYRVRYQDTPRAKGLDLGKETDDQLIARLGAGNDFIRQTAQRLLTERLSTERLSKARGTSESRNKLQKLVLDNAQKQTSRMHALWTLIGSGPFDPGFHTALLLHEQPSLRAWGVRAGGYANPNPDDGVDCKILTMFLDRSPEVQLQVAIVQSKIDKRYADKPLPADLQAFLKGQEVSNLMTVLARCGDDKLIPHIVWQNLLPLLAASQSTDEKQATRLAAQQELIRRLESIDLEKSPGVAAMLPKVIERYVGPSDIDPAAVVSLTRLLVEGKRPNEAAARQCFDVLSSRIQSGEVTGDRLKSLQASLSPLIGKILRGSAESPLYLDAALLATTWRDSVGIEAVRKTLNAANQPASRRLQALDALIAGKDDALLEDVSKLLAGKSSGDAAFRGSMIGTLGRLDDDRVGEIVLSNYKQFEPEVQPKAIELLTQRPAWTKQLLARIQKKEIPPETLNANQVRKLLASKDAELIKQVTATWGTVRTDRNPAREEVIARMRTFIRQNPGDAHAGIAIYTKVCGQCHKIHGQGQEVGPDITLNGRSSFDQLLSNVFDPSLVIGASYQARTVATTDGRILVGLLVEDNDQRVVLKTQGGKLETIARGNIDEMEVSKLSMMPEDLEKQIKPQELADLFAFITLDKPPTDASAKQLPGVRGITPQETTDAAKFNGLVAQILPGFTANGSGDNGMALLDLHLGRSNVLRTHPVAQGKPCILKSTIEVPAGKKAKLMLAVSHEPRGDWQLIVRANGQKLHESAIGPQTAPGGWAEFTIDLSTFASKRLELELLNQPTGWSFEHAFWSRAEVVVE